MGKAGAILWCFITHFKYRTQNHIFRYTFKSAQESHSSSLLAAC